MIKTNDISILKDSNKIISKYLISCRTKMFLFSLILAFSTPSISYIQSGKFDFIGSLLGCLITFSVYNISCQINTYYDYMAGVDTEETAVDRTLFEKMSVKELVQYTWYSFYLNLILMGILYMYLNDIVMFVNVLYLDAGMIISAFLYTHSKHIGLGHIVIVFPYYIEICIIYYLNTGEIMSQFNYEYGISYYLPLVVIGVLHLIQANYHRDLKEDKRAGIITIAILLGEKYSAFYYASIYIAQMLNFLYISIVLNNYYLILLQLIISPIMIKVIIQVLNGNSLMLNLKTGFFQSLLLTVFTISVLIGGKNNNLK